MLFLVALSMSFAACGSSSTTSTPPVDTSVPVVTSVTLPGGAMGSRYSATLTAMNGTQPYTWQGTAPAGLTINPTSGVIDGTLLTAGQLQFTVQVNDSKGKFSQALVTLPATYESLPTVKRYLLDANGAQTHMWARLLAEPVPARGATITVGSSNCPKDCFSNLAVEYGVDPLPNPIIIVPFGIGFSQDGQTIDWRLTGGGATQTGTVQTNSSIISVFNVKPKYLVVTASFLGEDSGQRKFPGESGTTKFLLDYK